jgi:hypothetical protein
MDGKTVFIGLRTTPLERLAVHAYAKVKGMTISDLIRATIVERAVKPLRQAIQAEVGDGQD